MISEFHRQVSFTLIHRFTLAATVCWLLASFCITTRAATLLSGFTETQISGLSGPTAMEFAPDGRLFVCLQGGQLRVIKNGVLLTTPFVSLPVDSSGERGLLGIAFDPNFQSNNFLYLYYPVPTSPIHNRVSRFTANGDVVVAGSEVQILNLDNLSSATNHNGGAIHFGPDGKLYVAVGENANGANSQTLSNRLGKVLRVNSDGSIPSDNPFFNTALGANRVIWALGLRNPFTFAFQPNTGRMFINDVGQSAWEEIDDGIAGSNYGWANCEGFCSPTNINFRDPLFEYGHGNTATTGCAIAGGAFYNPSTVQFPSTYTGKYFFADLCGGWIQVFDPSNNTAAPFATGISSPVDLKVSSDGSLYYLAIGSASVFKVQFPANQIPTVTLHPASQTVTQGQPVTFQTAASGTSPFTYQWQRNTVNIASATNATYTIATVALADNGAKFRCVITNAFGNATSNEATLTVQPLPPVILTTTGTDVAIAVDSVTMVRDPFPLLTTHNFSPDQHTRLMLFAINADLLPGETVSAQMEFGMGSFPVTVEFVGPVPGTTGLTEVIIPLPDGLPANSDVLVSITLRGLTSNKARFRMR
jgi:glucose/arabinose dehydrogenase